MHTLIFPVVKNRGLSKGGRGSKRGRECSITYEHLNGHYRKKDSKDLF
jgi:hypothetical protein